MTLPLSRNTTYSTSSPVKSNDLNDMQDRIIAQHAGVRGPYTVSFAVVGPSTGSNGALVTGGAWLVPFVAEVGSRILGYRVKLIDAATNTIRANLWKIPDPGVTPEIPGTTTGLSNSSATSQTISLTGLTVPVVSGFWYGAMIDRATGTGNFTVQAVEVDFDRV